MSQEMVTSADQLAVTWCPDTPLLELGYLLSKS